jgi:nucleotide-binding universal stress UspA family protein
MLEEEDEAARLLERATAICDSYGVHMKPSRVRSRDVATAILEAADRHDSQLLVLGAAHRPHVDQRHHTIGPTVETVLRGSRCRVMLVTDVADTQR